MFYLFLFLKLCVGHFVCDYPLQGDFLARAKNHLQPIPGVPWQWALLAHAGIQGGMVAYVTGVWWLGLAEVLLHCRIDYLKCAGRICFDEDQVKHLMCKGAWVLFLLGISWL